RRRALAVAGLDRAGRRVVAAAVVVGRADRHAEDAREDEHRRGGGQLPRVPAARGVRSPRGVERRDRRHRGRRGVGGGGGGRPHRRGRRRRATLVVEGGEGGGDRLLPGGGVRWRDVGGPEGVARRRHLRRPGGDVGPGPRRGRRLRRERAVDPGR